MSDPSGNSMHPNSGMNSAVFTGLQNIRMPGAMDVFKTEPIKTDNRPFECTICGNRFRQQCHLTQHIRIHTNDRPYQCSHCEKAFKQKSQLNQHERIHTGEKPYQCPLCAKAFPQAGQLYSHKKTHGINPRVTKDPPDGTGAPRRGRKRKNKADTVLSPPPVAYFIDSLHRPMAPFQNDGEHLKKDHFNKPHPISVFETPVIPSKSIERHMDQHLGMIKHEPMAASSSPLIRQKLIPMPRDHYQYYMQNYYQQAQYMHMQPAEASRLPSFARTVAELPSSSNFKKDDFIYSTGVEAATTTTTKSTVPIEGVPAHLKDLERLIPAYDQA